MPSTADGSKNLGLRSGSDRMLHVAYISAARYKGWCPRYHAIPNHSRILEPTLAGAQQVTFKLSAE
jgi:hypothetical protein